MLVIMSFPVTFTAIIHRGGGRAGMTALMCILNAPLGLIIKILKRWFLISPESALCLVLVLIYTKENEI